MTGGVLIPYWILGLVVVPLIVMGAGELIRLGKKIAVLETRLDQLEPKGGGDD